MLEQKIDNMFLSSSFCHSHRGFFDTIIIVVVVVVVSCWLLVGIDRVVVVKEGKERERTQIL